MTTPADIPPPATATAPFTDLPDLASERVGGAALVASDEFFAPKENLLRPGAAVWIADRYTDRGKWMDGWESRRKRAPGNDWCIVRLGIPGAIEGVDVDTSWFRGNYPERCSIDACALEGDPPAEEVEAAAVGKWIEVLPETPLRGHGQNLLEVRGQGRRFTHLRLNIFPDGGVARLRVHGAAMPDWGRLARSGNWVDLAAIENGGMVVACNDMFFGSRHNLIMPGRSANMGDGWETRRKRRLPAGGPAAWTQDVADWVVVRLGIAGSIRRIEVDTNHFKGNFPESCRIEGCLAEGATPAQLADPDRPFAEILPRTKLRAHARHFFEDELAPGGPYTHVRLSIFPDGGVSRLRLLGVPSADALAQAGLRRLNAMPKPEAEAAFRSCCGARRWVAKMVECRPFSTPYALFEVAAGVWWKLGADDWLEAFAAHPRIGSRKDVAAKAGAERRFAEREQAGAAKASEDTLAALAEANRAYEEKFGHIYIVCATGKSAEEMLALARARLANEPEAERRVAAEEQSKITRLRLEKLISP